MKRMIAGLILLVASFSVFALDVAAPSATTDWVYSGPMRVDGGVSKAGTAYSNGVISSSGDSTFTIVATGKDTLIEDFTPEGGFEYRLVYSAPIGTGADSTELIIKADCYDGSTLLNADVVVDSIGAGSTADGGQFIVPFFSTLYGNKFRLTVTGGAANGGQAIIEDLKLVRYKRLTHVGR